MPKISVHVHLNPASPSSWIPAYQGPEVIEKMLSHLSKKNPLRIKVSADDDGLR